jgi:hypothetical protein
MFVANPSRNQCSGFSRKLEGEEALGVLINYLPKLSLSAVGMHTRRDWSIGHHSNSLRVTTPQTTESGGMAVIGP